MTYTFDEISENQYKIDNVSIHVYLVLVSYNIGIVYIVINV